MIDLHCHILPSIDDGAKNKDISLEMLKEERKQGVQAIIFTPHFNFNRIDVDNFIEVRQKSYESLMSVPEVGELGMKFKLGCEVYSLFGISHCSSPSRLLPLLLTSAQDAASRLSPQDNPLPQVLQAS